MHNSLKQIINIPNFIGFGIINAPITEIPDSFGGEACVINRLPANHLNCTDQNAIAAGQAKQDL